MCLKPTAHFISNLQTPETLSGGCCRLPTYQPFPSPLLLSKLWICFDVYLPTFSEEVDLLLHHQHRGGGIDYGSHLDSNSLFWWLVYQSHVTYPGQWGVGEVLLGVPGKIFLAFTNGFLKKEAIPILDWDIVYKMLRFAAAIWQLWEKSLENHRKTNLSPYIVEPWINQPSNWPNSRLHILLANNFLIG